MRYSLEQQNIAEKHKVVAYCRVFSMDGIPFKGDAKFQIDILCFVDELMH